ncbi:MAG TPA: glycosyltransferase family protein [Candidatus Binatia bacterium]|nr:glycosyltransferase family protein [Candidatus Binatia bacterium]
MSSILYYVTGHGYGHAVRSSEVIRALKEIRPDLQVYVRTTAPRWLFPETVSYSRRSIDVGMVQRDSLDIDFDATLQKCRTLLSDASRLITEELAYIRDHAVGLIVGDIPALAFAIASGAGIPSAAVTNFTWTGIYRPFAEALPEFRTVAGQMARFYADATVGLALPYSLGLDIFPRNEPIAWIARKSALDQKTAREQFGLPDPAKVVLLSFGGLGLQRLPLKKLKRMRDFVFVVSAGEKRIDDNIFFVSGTQYRYEDLVRAADVIVTKPGYGIAADAISHRVPVLYTDRGDFPEYPHLVRALHDCATAEFIPQRQLLAGNIGSYLTQLLEKEQHWPAVELNGAQIAAEKLLELLGKA